MGPKLNLGETVVASVVAQASQPAASRRSPISLPARAGWKPAVRQAGSLRYGGARSAAAGFTLLELVVVLAILALLTALATRSLEQVEDQHRYEASQRSLADIDFAVRGDPSERAPDGTRVVSGFAADMGRLPKTVPLSPSDSSLSLRELWDGAGLEAYDLRPALAGNITPASEVDKADPDIVVAAGWRGPYLRLPLGGNNVLDGYGNGYLSPAAANPPNPTSTGYPRLQSVPYPAHTGVNQPILVVRHLGSNATLDPDDAATEGPYDRDQQIAFGDLQTAQLKAAVQVLDKDGQPSVSTASSPANALRVVVRVFSPADDLRKIVVAETPATPATISPAGAPISSFSTGAAITGLTVGRRPVRAYLLPASSAADSTTPLARSVIKYVNLQPGPGVNFVEFTIPYTSATAP